MYIYMNKFQNVKFFTNKWFLHEDEFSLLNNCLNIELGVDEWVISLVKAMCSNAQSRLQVSVASSEPF